MGDSVNFEHDIRNLSDADIKQSGYIIINITKKEVQNRDYSQLNYIFQKLQSFKIQGKNKMVLLFAGYDDIADEVYQIPEIRSYVGTLFNKHPHMFYFLSQVEEIYKLIFLCLCDIQTIAPNDPSSIKDAIFDKKPVSKVGITFSVPRDIKSKLIDSTVNYAKSIGDSENSAKSIIDGLLSNGKKSDSSMDYNVSTEELIDAYEKVAFAMWKGLVQRNLVHEISEIEALNFVKENSSLSRALNNIDKLASFVPAANNKQVLNLVYVKDNLYGEICNTCGTREVYIYKPDISTIDPDHSVYLPSIEGYIKSRILPTSEEYFAQVPIPVDPHMDKWICPNCLKMHKFKYDKNTGLSY